MRIIGINGGHDGGIAVVSDSKLSYVREAEKGSHQRHAYLGADTLLSGLVALNDVPDVIAHSGWWKGGGEQIFPTGAGYHGLSAPIVSAIQVLGRPAKAVFTSHERSHIWCSLGLSPIDPRGDCQALLWEGDLGNFYRVSGGSDITLIGRVLSRPGARYVFPYGVADPTIEDNQYPGLMLANAGKVMALAGFCQGPVIPDRFESSLLTRILEERNPFKSQKAAFRDCHLYNCGVDSDRFKRFVRLLSDDLFDRFWSFAESRLDLETPLVIGGGCGLNCEWNTRFAQRWRSLVFVPPCPNDSGVAIGAAIDAQQALGGPRRVDWRIDLGDPFVMDRVPVGSWVRELADSYSVARLLHCGAILGWVSGRFELGPRALGNRSVLASPLDQDMCRRLNNIKLREQFRPIAPVCQLEHIRQYFEWTGPSPYMLYFQRVVDKRLKAVTHVDETARVQTVSKEGNQALWTLLEAFREVAGVGVLCNTSLNFKGLGFINDLSELEEFAHRQGLDGFIIDGEMWIRHGIALKRAHVGH